MRPVHASEMTSRVTLEHVGVERIIILKQLCLSDFYINLKEMQNTCKN